MYSWYGSLHTLHVVFWIFKLHHGTAEIWAVIVWIPVHWHYMMELITEENRYMLHFLFWRKRTRRWTRTHGDELPVNSPSVFLWKWTWTQNQEHGILALHFLGDDSTLGWSSWPMRFGHAMSQEDTRKNNSQIKAKFMQRLCSQFM